jgi:predicted phosphodiesterase
MKIQVLSDLHLEVTSFDIKVHEEAEVLVLAGDIIALQNNCKKLYCLENIIKKVNIPIVYIFGNHENYGYGRIKDNVKIVKTLEVKYPHFHFLDNETWIYKDVEFIGSTLWTDFELAPSKVYFVSQVEMAINDFNLILSDNVGHLTVRDVISMNIVARRFIDSAVRVKNGLKKVVVTHFVPTEKAIALQYVGNSLNPYFVCDCENLMVGVHTWIFGHTHASFDFMLTKTHESGHVMVNTHMVCNPRGYNSENKNGFDKMKLIEI